MCRYGSAAPLRERTMSTSPLFRTLSVLTSDRKFPVVSD
jgi:hypothetical protein